MTCTLLLQLYESAVATEHTNPTFHQLDKSAIGSTDLVWWLAINFNSKEKSVDIGPRVATASMWISMLLILSVLLTVNGEEKAGKGYKESPVLSQKAYKEKDTSSFLGVQIERDDAHVVVRSLVPTPHS